VTWRGAKATLTDVGNTKAFNNFYPNAKDRALDPVTFSVPKAASKGDGGKPPSTKGKKPGKNSKPKPAATGPGTVTTGSLTWGVSSRFRSYVTGPIANGSISLSGGASSAGGAYRFWQRSTDASGDRGVGTTSYGGAVTFRGHHGELNMAIADPQVVITGNSATLRATIGGSRTTLGNLDLSRGQRSTSGGAVHYSGVPVSLAGSAVGHFRGFYPAGTALDPVSFTIGSSGGAAGGSTTVASADAKKKWKPPAKPPATTGLTIEGDLDKVKPGQKITASGGGFGPNEEDIKVVVYSEPVVLERTLTADAGGNATWTGLLPETMEPGEHTLTFQGSTDLGGVFTVVEDDDYKCEIDDASLTWGVKESFRSYVTGSIANGSWDTKGDVDYKTPAFTWSKGSGGADDEETQIDFDGTVTFTGHEGALNMQLINPTLRLDGDDTAYLVVDAVTTDREAAMAGDSEETELDRIPLVELDTSAVKPSEKSDGAMEWSDVPTALTSQGADVFGSYESGEAFDDVSFSYQRADDCGAAAAAAPASTKTGSEDGDSDNLLLVGVGIGAAVALLVGGSAGVMIGIRRGRANA